MHALYRQLLALRQRELAPRLSGMGGNAGRFVRLGDRALTVDWQLGDGSLLTLVANLGDEAVRLPAPKDAGKSGAGLLFALPSDAARVARKGSLSPWAVVFWLEAAPQAIA